MAHPVYFCRIDTIAECCVGVRNDADLIVLRAGTVDAIVSQVTLGRSGDFLMSMLIIVVVVVTVSAQIHSLSAIFMYDIYQTYINPFPEGCLTETTSPTNYRTLYVCYNSRNVYIRHIVVIFLSVLAYPVALAFMAIELDFVYKVMFIALITAPSVLPVWISMIWYRTTGLGVILGIVVGLVGGFATWFSYAASFPGGLTDFVANTGRLEVFDASAGVSLVASGIVCIVISLFFGGDDRERKREEGGKWESCLSLDNPAKPWALQYAAGSSISNFVGIPTYRQVRTYITIFAFHRECLPVIVIIIISSSNSSSSISHEIRPVSKMFFVTGQ